MNYYRKKSVIFAKNSCGRARLRRAVAFHGLTSAGQRGACEFQGSTESRPTFLVPAAPACGSTWATLGRRNSPRSWTVCPIPPRRGIDGLAEIPAPFENRRLDYCGSPAPSAPSSRSQSPAFVRAACASNSRGTPCAKSPTERRSRAILSGLSPVQAICFSLARIFAPLLIESVSDLSSLAPAGPYWVHRYGRRH